MIELRQLNKYYKVGKQRFHALKDVDLTIGDGEMVAVVGKSGAGKSTLMNIIGLVDTWDSGEYLLDAVRTAVETELAVEEPSLIISRRPCALLKNVKHNPAMTVDADKCTGCKSCLKAGCPAISVHGTANNGRGHAVIDPNQCVGCEICAKICRFNAISFPAAGTKEETV